jgi:cell division protein FtsB
MRKRNYIKTERSVRTSRRKKLLIAGAALLGIYLLSSLVLGEMGMVKYYRMKGQYQALVEDIARLKQDNAKMIREVHALKTDPACIERIARDKLGLARPGEIVYYYRPE